MSISVKCVTTFIEGLDHAECVTTGPDGTLYAGGEAGRIYRILPDGKKLEIICSTGRFIVGVAVSPDGKFVLACDLVM